jgi:hypothetical protein
MRLKKHHEYVWPEHSNKSAKAEHSINSRHHIHLQNTSILSTKPLGSTSREVTNIELHFNNMNREDGRYYRVLTMVYNTEILGFRTLSIVRIFPK